jgi:DNA-binding MarR family transcriptional regulator
MGPKLSCRVVRTRIVYLGLKQLNTDDRAKLMMEVIPPLMRQIREQMRLAAGGKLTVPQFRLIIRLSRMPMSNQEISEWMGVSAPTMSKMIDKVAKRGLVKRKAGKGDRRQISVECTAKGLKLAQDMGRAVQAQFAKKIALLTSDQAKALEVGISLLKETFL